MNSKQPRTFDELYEEFAASKKFKKKFKDIILNKAMVLEAFISDCIYTDMETRHIIDSHADAWNEEYNNLLAVYQRYSK